jgi:hypothetical protein
MWIEVIWDVIYLHVIQRVVSDVSNDLIPSYPGLSIPRGHGVTSQKTSILQQYRCENRISCMCMVCMILENEHQIFT